MLKLNGVESALANFLASGVLRLGPKLGPMLWQFPERLRFEPDRFRAFLDLLPRTTKAALARARKHDRRVSGRSWPRSDVDRPLRHAVEIRHESFRDPAFIDLLRRYDTALVCADTVEWPLLMDLTSDFVYCRLHGSQELYASGYGPKALDRWARRIGIWARGGDPPDAERVESGARAKSRGRDVFVYFDNDAKVRAPVDAMALAKRLGLAAPVRTALRKAALNERPKT